jgi:beta-xylosidase
MKKITFLIVLSLLTVNIMNVYSQAGNKQRYLFSYFRGNGVDGLHLAASEDGFKWTPLNGDSAFITPSVGQDKLMRDPSICLGADNVFHMVWTVSWHEKGIGYADSKDLIHWSQQKYIPVMEHEKDAVNCWAPELFYDEVKQQYLIFWATTIPGRFPETDGQNKSANSAGLNHRIYYVTTKDFKTFSDTKIFYNQGFNVIDATIAKDGNRYLMFLKDETNVPFTPQKNIRIAFSDAADGPYSKPTAPITGSYWAEGPSAIKIGNKWLIYFDKYRENKYGVVVSEDLQKWEDLSNNLDIPKDARHGTVFCVPESVYQNLLKLK